jgi:sulfonate transport system permease protein
MCYERCRCGLFSQKGRLRQETLLRMPSNSSSPPHSPVMTTQAKRLPWVFGLIVPLTLGLIWEGIVAFGFAEGRLAPPPSRLLSTLWTLAVSGELFTHALVTLKRISAGFFLGAITGMMLGALTGASVTARMFLDPTLQALRAIPSIAWVPLFILWLGIFEASKIALIALGVFFPVYLGVAGAIICVDRKLIEVGRIFRLSRTQLARHVLLPAILPSTIIALRSGLGLGFMFVVAAEYMGASEGLGYLLLDGQQLGKPAQIIAAILTFAVLGKATDTLLVMLTRPLTVWQDISRERM